jgi:hypothetical protein
MNMTNLQRETRCARQHDDRAQFPAKALKLADLLGVTPALAADEAIETRLAILAILNAALEAEKVRGKAKSWLHDINRHLNLCAAIRQEMAGLGGHRAEMNTEECELSTQYIDRIAA